MLKILPSGGPQKECYVAMASFYPKISSGGPQKGCYVVMAPSHSKFNPHVAHKRDAALQWLLPTLNLTLVSPTKGMQPRTGIFLL